MASQTTAHLKQQVRRPSKSMINASFAPTGANTSLSRRQRLDRWLRHHRRESYDALGQLKARPLQTTMLVCLMSISLSFPFFFGWLVHSFHETGLTQEVKEPTLSAYLHSRASEVSIDDLRKRLEIRPDVVSVVLISADQGLEELKVATGLSQILSSMSRNPLPSVLEVRWTPPKNTQRVPKARALMNFLQQQPIVDSVTLDTQWLDRLRSLEQLAERLTWVLSTLFCLGVVLAIFNGVQLMIEQNRFDIQIAQRVGASASFVRRPFLYVGGLLGLLGGVLAAMILLGVFSYLNEALNLLLSNYGVTEFQVHNLPLAWCLMLILLSMVLGWLGSRIAVNKALC